MTKYTCTRCEYICYKKEIMQYHQLQHLPEIFNENSENWIED